MWRARSGSRAHSPPPLLGRRIEIRGTVQGVGFRPWVYRLAHEVEVGGRVRNDARGVTIEAFGTRTRLDTFVHRLRTEGPPAARIRDLRETDIPHEDVDELVIVHSGAGGERSMSIPADIATCPACLAEVRDPTDRRHRYAFTNCTNCGPRFTIAEDIPYDRPATTMVPFPMCSQCEREYRDVLDRRFHAQPNACPTCGPQLYLVDAEGEPIEGDPIEETARLLLEGGIVAIKGLGGFHLACDATREGVVHELRRRKHRDEKPFAVMAADLEAAHRMAFISPEEEALLTSPERPITLVEEREGSGLAPSVAPDTDVAGLFLPYTPLHHLLLEACGRPLVMTSANLASEPICQHDEEARQRLAGIADALLGHDRRIATRCDDSVVRLIAGAPTVLRRSRGYVPQAIPLEVPVHAPVLAVGGHLKNTFCLARGDQAWLGPHVGDLDTLEAETYMAEAIDRMERILEIHPEIVAHDMHPEYASTAYAQSRRGAQRVAVQHHHAHVVSAMAEHGLEGPVIGVAFDGTGWGPDGTAWGGEILLAAYDSYRRLGTFRPLPLAGGETAIKQPWRIALALVEDAFDGEAPLEEIPVFQAVPERDLRVVRQMIREGIQAPMARGVGRLFDGIGALGLGRATASYEGQVAIAWNLAASPSQRGRYPYSLGEEDRTVVIDPRPMVRAAVEDLMAGMAPEVISARFHRTLVIATADVVRQAARHLGRLPVVLSGGVFQNPLLTSWLQSELRGDVSIHIHRSVPPNDGGIALGQALVAAADARVYLA